MRAARPPARPGMVIPSALCLIAVLPGCGGSSPAPIRAGDATTLRRDVQSIRSAVAENNPRMAQEAVGVLQSDIGRLAARGKLSRSDARVLMIEASQVNSRVLAEVQPPTPSPTASQPRAVSPPAPGVGNENGNGNGNDKGKDKGNGNGNGNGKGHGPKGGDGGD